MCVCVCVCVCEREREWRGGEGGEQVVRRGGWSKGKSECICMHTCTQFCVLLCVLLHRRSCMYANTCDIKITTRTFSVPCHKTDFKYLSVFFQPATVMDCRIVATLTRICTSRQGMVAIVRIAVTTQAVLAVRCACQTTTDACLRTGVCHVDVMK